MTAPLPSLDRLRVRLLALVVVALTAGLVLAPAQADAQRSDRRLTVMTQNLYLGASLDAAVAAQTPAEFAAAVHEIYQNVVATSFRARAPRIAAQIARTRPDVVGLQEATLWRSGPLELPGTPQTPARAVEYDFLRILQRELRRRRASYRAVVVNTNADIEVPSPLSGKDLRLTDRDVILVRNGISRRGIRISNPRRAHFSPAAQLRVNTLGGPVEFTRGWASVDVRVRGRRVRFVNTHLEVQAGAPFQLAQAQELLAGPAATRAPVVMVGDFNSNADPRNPDTPTYATLTAAGFRDAWRRRHPRRAGFTCCQAADLANGRSQLSQRIDLVLTKPALRVARAELVGESRRDKTRTRPSLWPSDHAGVVVQLRIGGR